jgi:hypothetical protein
VPAVAVSVFIGNGRQWREWQRTLALGQLTAAECQAADGDLQHYYVTGPEEGIKAMIALCPCIRPIS